ncbi:hypothetical protein [Azospirillum sp. ST 5-10]|uniref:hypothetical protein n=1 Tax=unclassified Azospirillum TaxID=2630922 RepID=UPI003F4A7603
MRALSIRSPWWWWILQGAKPVENRPKPTKIRGTILVHTSKWWRTVDVLEEMYEFSPIAERAGCPKVTAPMVRPSIGCIVGQVAIVDCVTRMESPWFFGPYGYVLERPVVYERPIPCKGMLGFWTPPAEVLAALPAVVRHG